MRRLLTCLVVISLLAGLFASETFAQRGRRGGGARRSGRAFSAPSVRHLPNQGVGPKITAPKNSSPRPNLAPLTPRISPPTQGLSRPNHDPAKFNSLQGSTRDRASGLQNAWDKLGTQSPTAAGQRPFGEAALGWIDSANQPFTPAWYLDHPNAWQATHPHADTVAVVTAATVGAWLTVPYATSTSNTVTTTVIVEPTPTEADPADVDEAADTTEWMSLGVFALKPAGQTEATRVVQLAVARDGRVGGSHYDLLSDTVQDLQGAVNKQDHHLTWTIGERGSVTFEVQLDELSKPHGEVTAHFPSGKTGSWRTVPVPK